MAKKTDRKYDIAWTIFIGLGYFYHIFYNLHGLRQTSKNPLSASHSASTTSTTTTVIEKTTDYEPANYYEDKDSSYDS